MDYSTELYVSDGKYTGVEAGAALIGLSRRLNIHVGEEIKVSLACKYRMSIPLLSSPDSQKNSKNAKFPRMRGIGKFTKTYWFSNTPRS